MFLCGEAGRSQGRIYLEVQHLSQPEHTPTFKTVLTIPQSPSKKFVQQCSKIRACWGDPSGSFSDGVMPTVLFNRTYLAVKGTLTGTADMQGTGSLSPPILLRAPVQNHQQILLPDTYICTYIYIYSVRTSPLTSSPQSSTDSFHSSCAPAVQCCNAAANIWSFSRSFSFTSYSFQSLSLPTVPHAVLQLQQGLIKVKYAEIELVTRKSPSITMYLENFIWKYFQYSIKMFTSQRFLL